MRPTVAATITPDASASDSGPPEQMVAVETHPRAVRWMHWVNFPLLLIMIYSGLRIYWAERVYRIGWGDWTLFEFFPTGFNEALNLNQSLARGLAWHFFFGWLFVGNGVLYVLFTGISGEWRELLPQKGSFGRAWQVVLHDLHLRTDEPAHRGLYNDAQRLTYTAVIVMGLGAVMTGFAIYKPIQLGWLVLLFGGYQSARVIHFVLTLGFSAFFVIHIIQVIRAGFGSFWSMIVGYRRVPVSALTADADADVEEVAS